MTTPSTYKLGYPDLKYSAVPSFVYSRAPTSSDIYHPTAGGIFPLSTIWVVQGTTEAYILTAISGSAATWDAITDSAGGSVDGPASATNNAVARFSGTTGKLIKNSVGILTDAGVFTGITQMGINAAPTAQLTFGASGAAANTAPIKLTASTPNTVPEIGAIEFSANGEEITYVGTVGPTRYRITAIAAGVGLTANSLIKIQAGSHVTFSTVLESGGVMTFPAGGGNVLTAGGAAARKGSVTLVGGDSGAIATTSVAADSAICLTITALGTVSAPQALYVTITPGTSFTITSADVTDTSTITWAIVG